MLMFKTWPGNADFRPDQRLLRRAHPPFAKHECPPPFMSTEICISVTQNEYTNRFLSRHGFDSSRSKPSPRRRLSSGTLGRFSSLEQWHSPRSFRLYLIVIHMGQPVAAARRSPQAVLCVTMFWCGRMKRKSRSRSPPGSPSTIV